MAKLSAQTKRGFLTRTERQIQAREEEKARAKAQKEYEELKARAELSKEELAKVQSIEEYKQKYSMLDPEIKPFFQTPVNLQTAQTSQIESNKKKVIDKKQEYENKITAEREAYSEKNRKLDEWYNKQVNLGLKTKSIKDQYKKQKRQYEYDFQERLAEYQGYAKGLDEGLQRLEKGDNLSYGSIDDYASQKAQYERDRIEAKNEGREQATLRNIKISELKRQGYEPQVIESSYKGKPEETKVVFYNPKLKDFQKVEGLSWKSKPTVKVEGLKTLGYSEEIGRTIDLGGNKNITYQSRVPIFESETGEIVTPYEKTGIDVESLKPAYLRGVEKIELDNIGKIVTSKDLPYGYEGQQSISDQETSFVLDPEQASKVEKQTIIEQGIFPIYEGGKMVFSKILPAYNWASERIHFDFGIGKKKIAGGLIELPQIQVISLGKKIDPTFYEKGREGALEFTGQLKEDILDVAYGVGTREELKRTTTEKYEKQYQSEFLKYYGADIYEENIGFEDAVEQFKETEQAKKVQEDFLKEYNQGLVNLKNEMGLGHKTKWMSAYGVVSLSELGFSLAKDPLTAGLVIAGVGTGEKIISAIPQKLLVSVGTQTGFGVYGTYKFLDPSSSFEEASSGLITAIISASTLAYTGYRYLKSPVVKRVKIPKPKRTLKASEVEVYKTKTGSEVPYQKVYQTSTEGYRTTVTTKGRTLLTKYTPFKPAKIYEGVPYSHSKEYESAIKLLTKYGYSPTDAKTVLRYSSPKYYEQYIEGITTIDGKKFNKYLQTTLKRPVIDVDKTLGIKTRGSRDLITREYLYGSIGEKYSKGISFKFEGYFSGKEFMPTSLDVRNKVLLGKVSGLKKGQLYLGEGKGLKAWADVNYKDVFGASIDRAGRMINVKTGKSVLITGVPEEEQTFTSFKGSGAKTPWSVTFTKDVDKISEVKDIIKTKNFKNVLDKLDDISLTSTSSPQQQVQLDKYWGKGMYELTDVQGALPPMARGQLQKEILSQVIVPEPKITSMKDIVTGKILQIELGKNILMSNLLQIGVLSNKNKDALKGIIKDDVLSKSVIDQGIKLDQGLGIKGAGSLKNQIKQITQLEESVIVPQEPTIIEPTIIDIPVIEPTIIPPINIPWLDQFGRIRKRKKKKKDIEIQTYLPDFTSRALGLKAEIITQKQAKAKLKKMLTGLEIRRGVVVK